MKMKGMKMRGMAVCTLSLSVALLSGCTTAPTDLGPRPQVAVAKQSTSYVVKRASIRTPSTDRLQQQSRQVNSAQVRQQVMAQVNKDSGLTSEQYHARYQAELRAQEAEQARLKVARAAAEQREKEAAAALRQKEAKEVALRATYKAQWDKQQAALNVRKARALVAEKKVESVIRNAKSQIGTPYVWGGASPQTGFDCSGLVQHSVQQGASIRVPRTAAEQYRASVKVGSNQATRGDLVFFNTRGNSVSHVGIYLGNNKFLHAPRTGKTVTTSDISGYWKERLIGFGRIPGACRLPV